MMEPVHYGPERFSLPHFQEKVEVHLVSGRKIDEVRWYGASHASSGMARELRRTGERNSDAPVAPSGILSVGMEMNLRKDLVSVSIQAVYLAPAYEPRHVAIRDKLEGIALRVEIGP